MTHTKLPLLLLHKAHDEVYYKVLGGKSVSRKTSLKRVCFDCLSAWRFRLQVQPGDTDL